MRLTDQQHHVRVLDSVDCEESAILVEFLGAGIVVLDAET